MLVGCLRPSLQAQVSKTAFGDKPDDGSIAYCPTGETTIQVTTRTQARNTMMAMNRGLVSVVEAQSVSLAVFCGAPRRDLDLQQHPARVRHIFSQGMFDDASMWVADPFVKRTSCPDVPDKVKKKFITCGKNIFMLVCTTCEMVYSSRVVQPHEGGPSVKTSQLRCAEVHSPLQPLAAQNTSTIRKHWRRWCAITADGNGEKVDPRGSIKTALQAMGPDGWVTVVVNKDNLGLNAIILAMEEKALQAAKRYEVNPPHTLLGWSCMGHSTVLSTKEVSKRSKLPSILVKLGHLLHSAKSSTDFTKFMLDIGRASFNYRIVDELPAECVEWNRSARLLLKRTKAAQDLSEAQTEYVLQALNGNFDSVLVFHYCIRNRCPLNCNEDKGRSWKRELKWHYF